MSSTHSISELIERLDKGDPSPALELWERCICRLVATARQHLKGLPRRVSDEEDVAVVAFEAFLRGHQQGRFRRLENREDLWQVLAMLSERKAIAIMRHELAQKRGGGCVRGESAFAKNYRSSSRDGIDEAGETEAPASELLAATVREAFDDLNDEVSVEIALKRLEGYTNEEIAQQIGVSKSTIERKFGFMRERLMEKYSQ